MANSKPPSSVRTSSALQSWPASNLFASAFADFERMFDGFNRNWRTWPSLQGPTVRMDCAETSDGIELTAELPGLKEKDVHVAVSDGALTISGEKCAEKEQKDKDYSFVERTYGTFSRSIILPADIDSAKIKATMSDGVLKIVAPRRAKSEPHKIEVQAQS
jgi:HSP20 family protein